MFKIKKYKIRKKEPKGKASYNEMIRSQSKLSITRSNKCRYANQRVLAHREREGRGEIGGKKHIFLCSYVSQPLDHE